MIHEFIGIANNKVDIVNKQKKIVISASDKPEKHSNET
jgi:hypothetical protein